MATREAFSSETTIEFESQYYNQVRGWVREEVIKTHLASHWVPNGGRIVDIGGGSGRYAVWLAQRGHEVLLVDPSEAMTELARKKVKQEGLTSRIKVVCADPEEVLDSSHTEQYDRVLSNGVLMYLDNPAAHLDLIERVLKPGGQASIITKGTYAALLRLTQAEHYEEVDKLLRTARFVNNLGEEVLTVKYGDMKKLLGQRALLLADDYYGVRVASDNDMRRIDTINRPERDAILKLELALSQNPETRAVGHMLQFFVRKVSPSS